MASEIVTSVPLMMTSHIQKPYPSTTPVAKFLDEAGATIWAAPTLRCSEDQLP